MFIRTPEAHTRSLVKAVTWRVVGSLDTFVISWVVTGKLKYAGIILGVETFTKIAIYYAHEQFWAWLPWWRPEPPSQNAEAAQTSSRPERSGEPGPRPDHTSVLGPG